MTNWWSKSIYFLPLLLWGTAILIATLIPSSKLPDLQGMDYAKDKFIHFTMFCILVISFLWGYKKVNGSYRINSLLWFVTFSIFYGLLLETGQIFVPGRSFSWSDITANGLGSAAGALIGLVYDKLKSKLP